MKNTTPISRLRFGALFVLSFAAFAVQAGYKKGELVWQCEFAESDLAKYAIKAGADGSGSGRQWRKDGGKDGDGAMRFKTRSMGETSMIAVTPDVKLTGRLFVEAQVRGTEIGPGRNHWNGPKVMLPYTPKPGAAKTYPQLPNESGSFDWKIWIKVFDIPETAEGQMFALGLEEAAGEFWIDYVRVYRAEEVTDDPNAPAPFNEAAAKIPRGPFAGRHNPAALRGVMSGCKMDEESMANLQSWGANLVRLQIGLGHVENLDDYFAKLEKKLDWAQEVMDRCARHGMKVCIDLHQPPRCTATKHASNVFGDNYDTTPLKKAWRMIAGRFKDHPATYAYDISNEPACSPYAWDRIFRDVMKDLRTVDAKTPLVTETHLFWYEGENVIYSPHFYSPHTLTHCGVGGGNMIRWSYPGYIDGIYWDKEQMRVDLKPWIEFSLAHPEARFLVGEFSCILWSKGADKYIRDAIDIFEEYGWDWTYHAYREWQAWDVEYTHDENYTIDRFIKAKTDTDRKKELVKGLMYNRSAPPSCEGRDTVRTTGL